MVQVVKKVGVSVTIAARLQVVVMLVVSRVPTRHAVTNRLQIAASAALPHVVTNLLLRVVISRLQIAAKNLSLLVATSLLPHAVKNHMRRGVKNHLAIVATRHAVINLMPPVVKILTPTRALSLVRLSPAPTVVPQIAQLTRANPLGLLATLRLVLQHPVVKPLHHAETAQLARVLLAPVRHVPQPVHVAALPLTAVVVKL